jgi:hypothetical protein
LALVATTTIACNPNTTRPPFGPLPQAAEFELEVPMAVAMRVAAEALRLDSIPVTVVRERDGYLETGWFDARTGEPTGARPVGVEVVRVRGWATPGRVGHTDVAVEAVYRPMADPSRPGRDLERLVAPDHPVARRLEAARRRLIEEFGNPAQLAVPQPAAPSVRPDTVVRPDTLVRSGTGSPDTLRRPRPDTLTVPPVLRRILQRD